MGSSTYTIMNGCGNGCTDPLTCPGGITVDVSDSGGNTVTINQNDLPAPGGCNAEITPFTESFGCSQAGNVTNLGVTITADGGQTKNCNVPINVTDVGGVCEPDPCTGVITLNISGNCSQQTITATCDECCDGATISGNISVEYPDITLNTPYSISCGSSSNLNISDPDGVGFTATISTSNVSGTTENCTVNGTGTVTCSG